MFLLFVSLVGVGRQCLSKLRRSGLAAVEPSACPSGSQRSQSCIERKRILLAEFDDNFRAAPGSSSITANYLEVGLVDIGVDEGRYIPIPIAWATVFDERSPWSDVTELPLCYGGVTAAPLSGPKRNLLMPQTAPIFHEKPNCRHASNTRATDADRY